MRTFITLQMSDADIYNVTKVRIKDLDPRSCLDLNLSYLQHDCIICTSLFFNINRNLINSRLDMLKNVSYKPSSDCNTLHAQHDPSQLLNIGILLHTHPVTRRDLYYGTSIVAQASWILLQDLARALVQLSF